MRALCLLGVMLAGCSFEVRGTSVDDPGASGPTLPSPTQSVPNTPDLGATTPPTMPAPTPPPPPPPTTPAPPDMAQQRVGLACSNNAQCDPGLICAKSFGVGLGTITIPGGYCTLDCSKAACPAGSFCTTFSFGKYCASSCPPDPCRTGYVCCNEGGGQSGCTPTNLCSNPQD